MAGRPGPETLLHGMQAAVSAVAAGRSRRDRLSRRSRTARAEQALSTTHERNP
jgi:hypothetical protein